MKLWGDLKSGNCYKIQLTAALLDIDLGWVDVDIMQGQTQTPEFLNMNPNGKIPLLQLKDGSYLSESNAIVNYLAFGSSLLPDTRLAFSQVQQWQFFEQYSHEPYVAVARFINKYLGLPDDRLAEYQAKQTGGNKALAVMEAQLSDTAYLTGDAITVADVCLYAYTHIADEGGFDLDYFPAIQRWLLTIAAHPKFIPMQS